MTRTVAELETALLAEGDFEVDIDATWTAVERGAAVRRRRRAVREGVGVAALVVLVAVPIAIIAIRGGVTPTDVGQAPLAEQCTITTLPLPAVLSGLDENVVANLMVDGMDSTGRFIVASYDGAPDDVVVIVRWDNGIPAVLPINEAGLVAHGINAQGTVVGGHRTGEGSAWLYSDSGFTVLPTPVGAVSAQAFAINDRGDVAGEAVAAHGFRTAVVWRADQQYAARVLTAPGSAGARGINADGIVVGFAASGDGEESGRPYGWHPIGEGAFLALPIDYQVGVATQIRGEWAVGFGWHRTTGNRVAFRWDLVSDSVTTVDNWRETPFIGLSADGVIATETTVGPTMIIRGQAYRLPRLAEDRAAILMPVALNDDATVIVGRQAGLLRKPVVLWRC